MDEKLIHCHPEHFEITRLFFLTQVQHFTSRVTRPIFIFQFVFTIIHGGGRAVLCCEHKPASKEWGTSLLFIYQLAPDGCISTHGAISLWDSRNCSHSFSPALWKAHGLHLWQWSGYWRRRWETASSEGLSGTGSVWTHLLLFPTRGYCVDQIDWGRSGVSRSHISTLSGLRSVWKLDAITSPPSVKEGIHVCKLKQWHVVIACYLWNQICCNW